MYMGFNVSGFIYFRKKAEEVLREFESLSGDLIEIENQGVQVKGAWHMLDLECEF